MRFVRSSGWRPDGGHRSDYCMRGQANGDQEQNSSRRRSATSVTRAALASTSARRGSASWRPTRPSPRRSRRTWSPTSAFRSARFEVAERARPGRRRPHAHVGPRRSRAKLSQSRVSRLVTELERSGLIERQACPTDSRVVWATITPDGRDLLARVQDEHHTAIEQTFFKGLTAAEVKQLAELWPRVIAAAQSTVLTDGLTTIIASHDVVAVGRVAGRRGHADRAEEDADRNQRGDQQVVDAVVRRVRPSAGRCLMT